MPENVERLVHKLGLMVSWDTSPTLEALRAPGGESAAAFESWWERFRRLHEAARPGKPEIGPDVMAELERIVQAGRPVLLRQLHEGDAVSRAEAAWHLAMTFDLEAVEPLLTALGDEDGVSESAALGLGFFDDRGIVPPLLALFHTDRSLKVRLAAASSLSDHGEDVVPLLLPLLTDPDPAARVLVAEALVDEPDIRALGPLIVLLDDDAPEVRRAALEAIEAINGDDPDEEEFAGKMQPLLRHRFLEVRCNAAAYVLGACMFDEDHAGWSALLDRLKNDETPVRQHIAKLLNHYYGQEWISGERPVPGLVRALKDSDAGVRCEAAGALGGSRAGRAVLPLTRALQDPAVEVRLAALEALTHFSDERAIAPLQRMAERETIVASDGRPLKDIAAETIATIQGNISDREFFAEDDE